MPRAPRYFSEFRPNDYRVPRSRKDAYGWEPPLWSEERPRDHAWVGWAIWMVCIGLLVWYAHGWV